MKSRISIQSVDRPLQSYLWRHRIREIQILCRHGFNYVMGNFELDIRDEVTESRWGFWLFLVFFWALSDGYLDKYWSNIPFETACRDRLLYRPRACNDLTLRQRFYVFPISQEPLQRPPLITIAFACEVDGRYKFYTQACFVFLILFLSFCFFDGESINVLKNVLF